MSGRSIRLAFVVLCSGVLLAGLPAAAAARPSLPTHGSVDPYLSQHAAAASGAVPVLIHTVDRARAAKAVTARGGRVFGKLDLGNSVVAEVPADQLERLAAEPGIVRIAYDPPLQIQADPLDSWSTRLKNVYPQAIGAPSVWSGSARLRGSGVGVAVLDSGINAAHPDFRGIAPNGDIGVPRLLQSVNAIEGASTTRDDNGHGTFVAGIIGGRGWGGAGTADDGRYIGIAPDVNLLSVKVSDRNGTAHVSSVVEAIEWVLTHRDQYNIRVLNLSLASNVADSYATSVLDAAVELAWYSGIVVVVAGGNGGASGAPITAPANDPFVITVGATDDFGTASTADDRLASFSSFGPTRDGFSKPDLVAPGRHIVSTLSSRLDPLARRFPTKVIDDRYIQLSGTSASAPIVAGAVAQLLQARPWLKPGQVKWLLQNTARPVAGAGTGAGYPRIDAAVWFSGPVGNTDTGLKPNELLRVAMSALAGRLSDSVAWDTVAWDTVAWDTVAWDTVAWDTVAWDTVAWDTVARDTVAGD
ncbi:MAG TPA: S8 family peptidase [Chloroflexota bacterium]